MASESKKVEGILAEFAHPGELLHAAEKVRDAGYSKFDCHSPFPIHGMDTAMGLKRSPLGFIVAICAFVATLGGLYMQYWMNGVDYPFIISGKPIVSYQAYAPVGFGVAVLLSAFVTFFGMMALNKLPLLYHWLFNSKNFEKTTDNGFFISLEAADGNFDSAKIVSFFESIGATTVEVIESS